MPRYKLLPTYKDLLPSYTDDYTDAELVEWCNDEIKKTDNEVDAQYIRNLVESKLVSRQIRRVTYAAYPNLLKSRKDKEDKTMEPHYDTVTLLQMAEGIKFAECKYLKGKGHHFTFKIAPQLSVQKGNYVVVSQNNGPNNFNVVEVVDVIAAEDFEPVEDVTYQWVVAVLDRDEITEIAKTDGRIRKRMSVNKAIANAKAAFDATNVTLLPTNSDALIEDATITTEQDSHNTDVIEDRLGLARDISEDD